MVRETSRRDELHFHYDRAERLGRDDDVPAPPKGLFRRNRSLLIVLLDVLLLLLMFVLLQFVFRPGTDSKRVGDVTFTVNAFVFGDEIFASVEIMRRNNSEVSPGVSLLVTLRFPDGTEVADVIPEAAGESIVVRSVFVAPEAADLPRVEVEVEALGEIFSLATDAAGR